MRRRLDMGVLGLGFNHAATRRAVSSQYAVDDGGGAADTGANGKSPSRAVLSTGPAFHACVPVCNDCAIVPPPEDIVRAHDETHAASNAFVRFKVQTGDISKVNHS
jgi:hypothetical protein